MTFDGSIHAIKGAPPRTITRVKIPSLATAFICFAIASISLSVPTRVHETQVTEKSFVYEWLTGATFFAVATCSTVSVPSLRLPVIVARPPANLSSSTRGPFRTYTSLPTTST
jgi:hypothetical protein